MTLAHHWTRWPTIGSDKSGVPQRFFLVHRLHSLFTRLVGKVVPCGRTSSAPPPGRLRGQISGPAPLSGPPNTSPIAALDPDAGLALESKVVPCHHLQPLLEPTWEVGLQNVAATSPQLQQQVRASLLATMRSQSSSLSPSRRDKLVLPPSFPFGLHTHRLQSQCRLHGVVRLRDGRLTQEEHMPRVLPRAEASVQDVQSASATLVAPPQSSPISSPL